MKFFREVKYNDICFLFNQLDLAKKFLLESEDNDDINYYKEDIKYQEDIINNIIVEV